MTSFVFVSWCLGEILQQKKRRRQKLLCHTADPFARIETRPVQGPTLPMPKTASASFRVMQWPIQQVSPTIQPVKI